MLQSARFEQISHVLRFPGRTIRSYTDRITVRSNADRYIIKIGPYTIVLSQYTASYTVSFQSTVMRSRIP
jgi:hypothetical protein